MVAVSEKNLLFLDDDRVLGEDVFITLIKRLGNFGEHVTVVVHENAGELKVGIMVVLSLKSVVSKPN